MSASGRDNQYWVDFDDRPVFYAERVPCYWKSGFGGHLICCGFDDLTDDFIRSLTPNALILDIAGNKEFNINNLLQSLGRKAEIKYSFSHHITREKQWLSHMARVKDALIAGEDVVIRCLGGVHRSALCYVCTLMFLTGWDFMNCCQYLESRRSVKLDEAIYGKDHRDGTPREDNSLWLLQWEAWAKECQDYRLLDSLSQCDAHHDDRKRISRPLRDNLESVPCYWKGESGGCLICCGVKDLTVKFINTLSPNAVILDFAASNNQDIHDILMSLERQPEIQFPFSHFGTREAQWPNHMKCVSDALHAGEDVVIRCIGGVCRAALGYVCTLMFLTGWDSHKCRQYLEDRRSVKMHEAIHGGLRHDGSIREDNSVWLPKWEKQAKFRTCYRVNAASPQFDAHRQDRMSTSRRVSDNNQEMPFQADEHPAVSSLSRKRKHTSTYNEMKDSQRQKECIFEQPDSYMHSPFPKSMPRRMKSKFNSGDDGM